MAHFNSDDLLIKSQLLISKFRKQREASLKKQDCTMNKHITSYNPNISDQINSGFCNNNFLNGCDSYPQRDNDNSLLNKFSRQHYLSTPTKSHRNQQLSVSKNDDTMNCNNLSDSDNSLWSASTEFHNPGINHKTLIEKREFGIMTEMERKATIDDDDIVTPLSTVNPTVRSHLDQNKIILIDENKFSSGTENKFKRFASICTDHESENNQTVNQTNVDEKMSNSYQYLDEKLNIIVDENDLSADENNKMKFAFQLFQEEKQLENEIKSLLSNLEKLNSEKIQLTIKINNEQEHLNTLKSQKEELKIRRYEIFNGMSNEPNKGLLQNKIILDVSEQPNLLQTEENSSDANINLNGSKINSLPFVLDKEIVRNIVDKIIYKEFSNSEDNIFLINNKSALNFFKSKFEVPAQESNDECILSDVLSIKDLKIHNQSTNDDNIDCNSTAMDKMDRNNVTNSSDFPIRFPKLQSKIIKPAQSLESLNKNMFSSVNSRSNSRRKTKRTSASKELKMYLHHQSSSDETSSELTNRKHYL